MKAGIFFTGTGPILILATYDSLKHPNLVEKLKTKRIYKYIAFEVPVEVVKDRYGRHYDEIMEDLKQSDDLRVLDYDGHHILTNFSFKEITGPYFVEPEKQPKPVNEARPRRAYF